MPKLKDLIHACVPDGSSAVIEIKLILTKLSGEINVFSAELPQIEDNCYILFDRRQNIFYLPIDKEVSMDGACLRTHINNREATIIVQKKDFVDFSEFLSD